MSYDPPDDTLDDSILKFTEAFFSGRPLVVESALESLKASFGDSVYTQIADLIHCVWNEEFPSKTPEEGLVIFNKIQVVLEHTCEPHPCRLCAEKSALLMLVALATGLYSDAIQQVDQLLVLQEDGIMAKVCRGLAWLLASQDASTEEEVVACLTTALADFEAANALVARLSEADDEVYHLKHLREESPENLEGIAEINKAIDDKGFLEDYIRRVEGTGRGDAEPPPFDWLSMPVDVLVDRTLKPMIGQLLADMERFDEALPILFSSLEAARRSDDEEMIALMLYSIGPILYRIGRSDEAVLICLEGLTLSGSNAEIQEVLLEFLDRCLLNVKHPAAVTDAIAQWAGSDAKRRRLVALLFDEDFPRIR